MTLYEITGEYLALLEMAEDPETDPQAFEDTMEAIEADLSDKADGYARVIAELKGKEEALDAEIKRLTARKKAVTSSGEKLLRSLQKSFEAVGKTELETGTFKFKLRMNPPSVVIPDEALVPPEYLAIKTAPDKTAIRKALKLGEELEWAHLESAVVLKIN